MPEETELTSEEISKVLRSGKRLTKPVKIGAAALAGIVVLIIAGKMLFAPDGHKVGDSVNASGEYHPPGSADPAALAELLLDSLDSGGGGIVEPVDTLELPIQQLTGAQIDSAEYIEIPGIDYLDDTELLNAVVKADEFQIDSTLEFELAIAASMRPGAEFTFPQLWKIEEDTSKQIPVDTAAIIAKLPPAVSGASKGELDSLAKLVDEKERTLQMLASDNQALTTKLARSKPRLDSLKTAQLKKLIKIIETLPPAAAANMLASQTTEEITEILFKVKPRKAAQILQQLPPDIASDLAVKVIRQ